MEKVQISKRFPPFARIILAGPSNSGKSHLVKKILRFREEVCSPKHPKGEDTLLFFYLIDDPSTHMELRELFDRAEFIQGLDGMEQKLKEYESFAKTNDLYVVVEDLLLQGSKSKALGNLFFAFSHHLPIVATMFTTQSVYLKNSQLGVLFRNATSILFTGSNRLKSSLASFGREIDPSNPSTLLRVFESALEKRGDSSDLSYPYLLLNCLAQDMNNGGYLSGIFPNEELRMFKVDEIK